METKQLEPNDVTIRITTSNQMNRTLNFYTSRLYTILLFAVLEQLCNIDKSKKYKPRLQWMGGQKLPRESNDYASGEGSVANQARSNSATDQACAIQPRARFGGLPSKSSET